MKVFTFFYRKVVIQIFTEIVPCLKKICTELNLQKSDKLWDFLWAVRFPINFRNKNLKLKADFTGFSRTDGVNYTRLCPLVCSEQMIDCDYSLVEKMLWEYFAKISAVHPVKGWLPNDFFSIRLLLL